MKIDRNVFITVPHKENRNVTHWTKIVRKYIYLFYKGNTRSYLQKSSFNYSSITDVLLILIKGYEFYSIENHIISLQALPEKEI